MPNFVIDIEARFAQFNDGLRQIERNTASAAKKMERAFLNVNNAIKLIASAAVVRQIGSALVSITNELDDLGKKAEGIGITTNALSELRYAAEFSNLSVTEFDNAMGKLSRRLQDAKVSGSEASKVFRGLGIDPNNIKDAEDGLKRVADAFKAQGQGLKTTSDAFKLFEEAGPKYVSFLLKGSEAIEAAQRNARALGLSIDQEVTAAAARLKDEFNQLQKVIKGIVVPKVSFQIKELNDLIDVYSVLKIKGENWGVTLRNLAALYEAQQKSPTGTVLDRAVALIDVLEERAAKAQKTVADLQDKLERKKGGSTGEYGLPSIAKLNLALKTALQTLKDNTDQARELRRALNLLPTDLSDFDLGPKDDTGAQGIPPEVQKRIDAVKAYLKSLKRQEQSLLKISAVEAARLKLIEQQIGAESNLGKLVISQAEKLDMLRNQQQIDATIKGLNQRIEATKRLTDAERTIQQLKRQGVNIDKESARNIEQLSAAAVYEELVKRIREQTDETKGLSRATRELNELRQRGVATEDDVERIKALQAERRAGELIQVIRQQIDETKGLSRETKELNALRRDGGVTKEQLEQVKVLQAQRRAAEEVADALAKAAHVRVAYDEKNRRAADDLERLAKEIKDTVSPSRVLQRQDAGIATLVEIGRISEETAAAYQLMRAALKDVADQATETDKILLRMKGRAAGLFTDAIFEAKSFGDAIKQLVIEFAKLKLQEQIFGGLTKVADYFSGGGGAQVQALDTNPANLLVPVITGGGGSGVETKAATYNTYNIAADVSLSQVEQAVARGNKATASGIYDSRIRGGAFAS